MAINLVFAWWLILAGLVSGTAQGLFFHREDWLGGYGSWRRRMTRLGHIAFFGTGLINLVAAATVRLWALPTDSMLVRASSLLVIVGAMAMSTICYLAAWKKPVRHLFFIPVASLLTGVACLLTALLRAGV